MKTIKNCYELIGYTPILEVSKLFKDVSSFNNQIYAKLENLNPNGSIKDRTALYIIRAAEKSGKLQKGGTIIEATSGNTGIGLASIGASLDYKVILTMPDSMSEEKINMLKAYGAEIILTPKKEGMAGSTKKALELQKEIPNSIYADQFNNPSNIKAHYETTAPEIIEELGSDFDYFLVGVGSSGTLVGCTKYFKEQNKNIKCIGIEPSASPFLTKNISGPHKIQGIGAGFKPSILDTNLVDDFVSISDEEAYKWTKHFVHSTGMLIGISSGAALAAINNLIIKEKLSNKKIVTILPDSGDRYLSIKGLYN